VPISASHFAERLEHSLDNMQEPIQPAPRACVIGQSPRSFALPLAYAIVSVIANESEGEDDRLSRSVGDAVAQEAARSGGRIVDRDCRLSDTARSQAGRCACW
jgi:hypothetical protein